LLLSNAELRKTMGECARKTAENLSWDQVAEKTIDVYVGILASRNLERPRGSMPRGLQESFQGAAS